MRRRVSLAPYRSDERKSASERTDAEASRRRSLPFSAPGQCAADKGKNERREGCATRGERKGDADEGGGGGEERTESDQEIDFSGLAGSGDTRSPIVSPCAASAR